MTLHTVFLRRQAEEALKSARYNPKKLVLIHTAISLGATLLVTALNFLFSRLIAETSGLSGMGMRSLLTTAQSILELVAMGLLPFWEIGLISATLCWVRRERADFDSLLGGFRRFGAVMAQKILQSSLFAALAMALCYFSIIVFMLSPFSYETYELLEPLMEKSMQGNQAVAELMTPELMENLAKTMLPALMLFGVLYVAMAIPLFYRFRFSEFSLMAGNGAIRAIVESINITRKHIWQLIKLDLSFWWFYLLQGLCVALSYGDALLHATGISLPVSADVQLFLFYILGILGQLVLLWQCQAKISATYGFAYQALKDDTVL